jgi:hypothetical protein
MVASERREGTSSVPSNESQSSMLSEAPTTTNETTKSVIKIVHQNVNGIAAEINFNAVGLLLGQVDQKSIDILTMNEVNLNLVNKNVRNAFLKSFHSKHRNCSIQAAWCPTTIPALNYRPGGNQVSVFGPAVQIIKERQYDKDLGSSTRKGPLSIISAYRVSQSSLDQAGPSTVFSQEYMALQTKGVQRQNPGKRCLTELERILKEQKSK